MLVPVRQRECKKLTMIVEVHGKVLDAGLIPRQVHFFNESVEASGSTALSRKMRYVAVSF